MDRKCINRLETVHTILSYGEMQQLLFEVYSILNKALDNDKQSIDIINLTKDKIPILLSDEIYLTLMTISNNCTVDEVLKSRFKSLESTEEFIDSIHKELNISYHNEQNIQSNELLKTIDNIYNTLNNNIDKISLTDKDSTLETNSEDNLINKLLESEAIDSSLDDEIDYNFEIDNDVLELIKDEENTEDGTDDIVYNSDDLLKAQDLSSKQGKIDKLDETSASYSEDEQIDVTDVGLIPDIDEVVASIINRNEAVFRSCLELDRPYGMLYEKGLLTYKVVDGLLRYIPGVNSGTSVFERLYKAIIEGTGCNLITAPDLRNVPNAKNIETLNANYYPGYIFKYALGLIDDKKYTSWGKFNNALRNSITKRFKQLYKQELFFKYIDKIERIFSNAILVLSYESGAGIKLRVSLPGISVNTKALEDAIRTVTTYRSAGITITQVKGYRDVVDVQVLLQEDKFLDRPYWAYKAMKLKIDNQEKISLSDGLPIGRRVNGDIVEYKLDPSNRFLTFIAAGSGAGKGVLTLSLVAAAIGSNVPLFYMDFKPDMAPIFWNIEKRYNINTFTYDGMVKHRPSDNSEQHTLGYGMPEEVEKELGKFAGAIHYLKSVQLMCAMAQYRADAGSNNDIMFIFDETQAMQRLIKSAVEKTLQLNKEHKPKKVKGVEEAPDTVYQYTSVLMDWFKEINVNIDTYVNTTGRKSNTFCIFIAQNPDYSTWSNLRVKIGDSYLDLLSRITFADTIFKILGRGSTTSKYGLGGDGKKSVTPKELQYVANNRFFGMYDGKTTDGADITIFKPFLTLNSDNPLDKCWTKGMGKKFGSGSLPDDQYIKNVAIEHPGEPGFSNKYNIHTGTGLLGLTSMYCNGDLEKVKTGFRGSWDYCLEFFNTTGLINRYATPTDYMYDMSIDGLMMLENMIAYSPDKENSKLLGIESDNIEISTDGEKEIQTDIRVGNSLNDGEYTSTPDSTFNNTNNNINKSSNSLDDIIGEYTTENGYDFDKEVEALNAYNNLKNKREISENDINEYISSMLKNVPDGADTLDVMSSMIKQDVELGIVDNDLAEETAKKLRLVENGLVDGYDFRTNTILNNTNTNDTPLYIDTTGSEAYGNYGKHNKFTRIDTEKTANTYTLNDENSIDCRMAGAGTSSFIDKIMLNTYAGSQKYIDRLWKSVLNCIIDQGYKPATITRVSLYGGHMYINGKIIILDGVTGGRQNVLLRDIVNYRIMFKRFPMIRELRLDEDMVKALLVEYKQNAIEKAFKDSNKLEIIYIKLGNGKTKKCERNNIGDKDITRIENENTLRNSIDLECKSKSSEKWSERFSTDNIWGMKLAKSSMNLAGQHFLDKNKPSIGKAALYGTFGLIGGTIGFGLWGIFSAIKGVNNIRKGYK